MFQIYCNGTANLFRETHTDTTVIYALSIIPCTNAIAFLEIGLLFEDNFLIAII